MTPADKPVDDEIETLIFQARSISRRYYELTGRPLGVSGELAEYSAARLLGLTLAPVREAAYDATQQRGDRQLRIQIKGRAVERQRKYVGRVPSIKLLPEFDVALLVLLDKATYEVIEIWEAPFQAIRQRLEKPGSKSRNERGSMGISQFKSIAIQVWPH